jgi:hypothetical protein
MYEIRLTGKTCLALVDFSAIDIRLADYIKVGGSVVGRDLVQYVVQSDH